MQPCPIAALDLELALPLTLLTLFISPASGGRDPGHGALYLLSVPLPGPPDDGGASVHRIGAVSMSVALLDPQLSVRRAGPSAARYQCHP